MQKSFCGLLFGSWIFLFTILFCPFVGPAAGQARHEPRLEGVSFSEIAEWQTRYGGGAYGRFPAPAPECVVPLEIQPACQPKKMKKRPVRK
jgi:hypothetical protein